MQLLRKVPPDALEVNRLCCLIVRIIRKIVEKLSARKYLKVVDFPVFPMCPGRPETKVPRELLVIAVPSRHTLVSSYV